MLFLPGEKYLPVRISVYCLDKKCLKRSDVVSSDDIVTCKRCNTVVKIDRSLIGEKVERCCVCGLAYFYIERDFNFAIGCIVIVAAVVAFLITSNAFILLGVAALDFVLVLFFIKNKTVCYKCLTEYRGFKENPEHKNYDLGTASRFADK